MTSGDFIFQGHGANVVGTLGSCDLVQDMPTAWSNPSGGDAWVNVGTPDTALELSGATATVSCWVKSIFDNTSFVDNNHAVSKYLGATDKRGYRLGIDNDGNGLMYWAVGLPGAGGAVQATQDVSTYGLDTTEWFHMAGTFDTGVMKLYINGDLATEVDHSASTVEVSGNATVPFEIGAYEAGNRLWNGNIRDVRIWNSSLDITDIQEVFGDGNMAGATATGSLQGWWKMENESVTDSSTNSNNGAISGTAVWDKSEYNLNQIGSGSLSGSATVSGGTWNLRDSTYLDFDGVNVSVGMGDVTILDGKAEATVSCWMYRKGYETGTTERTGFVNKDNAIECWVRESNTSQCAMSINNDHRAFVGIEVPQDEWTHVVMTYQGSSVTGDSNDRRRLYLNGVLQYTIADGIKDTITNSASVLSIGGRITNYSFSGSLSDVSIYDTALTQSQIDLLYNAQWDGSPVGWWKLNEGSGVTCADSSPNGNNGTFDNTPTWVKPDYDMLDEGGTAGALVTISGAKLSAPQAELQLGQNENHVIGADTYIHNSGTLLIDANTGAGVNGHFYDSGNTYYNVSKTGSGWSNSWHSSTNDDTIVENTFDLKQSSQRFYKRLNMGTTGSRGTIICTTDSSSLTGYSDFELYGVSKLYPAFVTSSAGGLWSIQSTCAFSNIEVDFDWVTRGGGYVHTINGDCKFAGLDIKTTDHFIASGQRLEIGGFDSGWGGSTCNFNDSLVYLTDRYDGYIYRIANADNFYVTGSTFVMNMDTAANALGQMQTDQHFDNVAIVNDGLNIASHTLTCTGNLMIAAGGGSNNKLYSSDGNSGINVSGNVSIATDALYEPDDDIATIRGDFNVAGGFIGYGALDVTGATDVSAEYMTAAGFTGLVGAGEATIECWFRASDSNPESAGLVSLFPAAEWNINVNRSLDDLHLGWEWENDGTEIYMSNGPLLGPSDAQKWHHAVMTIHDTNGYEVYLDGKLEATGASLGNTADVSEVALTVGSSFYSTNYLKRGFSGAIARASVWNAVLTEAEIRSMMFQDWSTMAGADVIDDSKCVAWYEFSDDQNADSVSDMSGSGNTGTLSDNGAWAGEGDVTVPSANPSSKIVFDNDGGTCNYIFGVDAPTYTHGLDFRTLEVASGTSLVVQDVGTYGSPYFWCSDRHLRLMSGSTISGSSGLLNLIRYRQEGGAASGSIYAEENTSWGNFGFYMDGNNPIIDMPASSSTVETFTLNTYINISDSTNMHLTKDTTIIANDGIYTGRKAHTTLTEGKKLICNRVRPHSGDDGPGNAFSMEAGSTIQFTGSSGFADGDDNSNSMYRVNANGEAATMFTDIRDAMYIGAGVSGTYNSMDSFSTSCWMKVLNNSTDAGLITKGWTGALSFYISLTAGGAPQFYSWHQGAGGPSGGNKTLGTTQVDDGDWHHIATTYDSSSGYKGIWVDGVEEDGDTTSGGALDSSDEIFGIGNWFSGPTTASAVTYGIGGDRGSMADVRIWDGTVLTSGNIVALAAINPATDVSGAYADNPSDPSSWWKLGNTGSGLPAIDLNDYGTNGYDAVMTGSTASPAGMKSGFCHIYRSDAGTWALTPDRIKTGLNADSVWTLQNTYTGGDLRDPVICSGQTLITKGTVGLD